jgi:hypothetical protein
VPARPYDVPVFATPKVAPDRHVEALRALYSVPGESIGQRVQARADSRLVKIYSRGQLIKTHPRKPPGGRSTDPKDYPVGQAEYALRDVATLKKKAAAAGVSVGVYAARLLDVPLPWTSMRAVYRLLGLTRSYAATRGGQLVYRAVIAQWHRDRRAARPKFAKLAAHDRLREYVQDRLAGVISTPGGRPISGPSAKWNGRNQGRRQDRRWANSWSPEQIANRLPVDPMMRRCGSRTRRSTRRSTSRAGAR